MPVPVEQVDAAFFSQAFRLQWWDSGLATGETFDLGSCRIAVPHDPQEITLDVTNVAVRLEQSGRPSNSKGVRIGFPAAVSVILADNLPGAPPVHLLCKVPLRSAGVEVSAVVPGPTAGMGGLYHATMWVRLAGQTNRWPVSQDFILDAQFGSAPCLAVKVLAGQPGIEELWFDVHGDSNASTPPDQVAIDDLWFT